MPRSLYEIKIMKDRFEVVSSWPPGGRQEGQEGVHDPREEEETAGEWKISWIFYWLCDGIDSSRFSSFHNNQLPSNNPVPPFLWICTGSFWMVFVLEARANAFYEHEVGFFWKTKRCFRNRSHELCVMLVKQANGYRPGAFHQSTCSKHLAL